MKRTALVMIVAALSYFYIQEYNEVKVVKNVRIEEGQKSILKHPSSISDPYFVYPEEIKRYQAQVIQTSEEPIKEGIKRTRLLKTNFKYPLVRTEEVIRDNKVISRIEMVASHVLVQLQEEDKTKILNLFPNSTLTPVSPDPLVKLYTLSIPNPSLESVPLIIETLSSLDISSDPDYIRHALLSPNDSAYVGGLLWGLHQNSDVDIDAPEAWDVRTESTVIVAVIDTGVRYNHEDLDLNMWKNPSETLNGVDDDNNGYVDDVFGIDTYNRDGNPMDDQNHGTHCSGTIGGIGNNSKGVTGVSWKTRIMALKFLSSTGIGTDSDAIACMDYARLKGAKVFSCSWGGGAGGNTLSQAIDRARSSGIIVVCAAGNDATNNDALPMYPASFPQDNIVAVASINRFNSLSFFSNYGAISVDIVAPGESIYSTVASTTMAYATYSGTSMATPHVAGAVSLIMSQYPSDSYASVLNRLFSNTDSVPGLVGKTKHGRLNLARSLNVTPSDPVNPVPPPTPNPTNSISNDMFSNAVSLSSNFSVSGNNSKASKEVREPVHAFVGGGRSMWYAYTPSSTGMLTIDTRGSDFDTVLAIYTGNRVSFLQNVAYNDDFSRTEKTSRIVVKLNAGVRYMIAVDGYKDKSGNFKLNGSYISKQLLSPPSNIKLSLNSQSRAVVAWSRVTGATFFEVSLKTGDVEFIYTTTQTSITPSKVFSRTLPITARVRAYDRDRDPSNWSESITLRAIRGFDAWWSSYSNISPMSNDILSADPDGDGKTNLQEYAFNGNPLKADNSNCSIQEGDYLTIQYQKRIDDPGLRYTVESSNDLNTWSSNTIQVSSISTQGEYQTVNARSITPKSNMNKQFMRVKVTYDNGY